MSAVRCRTGSPQGKSHFSDLVTDCQDTRFAVNLSSWVPKRLQGKVWMYLEKAEVGSWILRGVKPWIRGWGPRQWWKEKSQSDRGTSSGLFPRLILLIFLIFFHNLGSEHRCVLIKLADDTKLRSNINLGVRLWCRRALWTKLSEAGGKSVAQKTRPHAWGLLIFFCKQGTHQLTTIEPFPLSKGQIWAITRCSWKRELQP